MRYFYDAGRGAEDDDESPSLDGAGELDARGLGDDDPTGDADALEDDDDALDDDFPRGDGTADTSAVVYCPYCGELNEIGVDPGGGSTQRYVEDCEVCCRPWRVSVTFDGAGQAAVTLEPADDL